MLTGRFVRLRAVERSDLETLRQARNRPDVARFYESKTPITQPQQEAWFDRVSSDDRAHYFVAETGEGEFLGSANVKNINWVHRHGDYGLYIVPAERRNPLVAVEAAVLVLDYAFDALNLHKVFGNIMACNSRSLAFNEGLGFEREGVLKEHAWHEGAWVDLVQVALFAGPYRDATAKYRSKIGGAPSGESA